MLIRRGRAAAVDKEPRRVEKELILNAAGMFEGMPLESDRTESSSGAYNSCEQTLDLNICEIIARQMDTCSRSASARRRHRELREHTLQHQYR
jgi:hypothetical protein